MTRRNFSIFASLVLFGAVLSAKTFCTFMRELSPLGLQEDRARNTCGGRHIAQETVETGLLGPDEALTRYSPSRNTGVQNRWTSTPQ